MKILGEIDTAWREGKEVAIKLIDGDNFIDENTIHCSKNVEQCNLTEVSNVNNELIMLKDVTTSNTLDVHEGANSNGDELADKNEQKIDCSNISSICIYNHNLI
nr:uncharacterized protein LOC111421772 [Onthophagus taurus]